MRDVPPPGPPPPVPPPLVLLHGFTGSAASWGDALLSGLGARGRKVVAVDLPGHGRRRGDSAPECFTLERALDVVGEAMGPAPCDLLGYSMGGRIALHYAVRYPSRVRRLVLESSSPGLETAAARADRQGADESLARAIERSGVAAFVAEWERKPLLRGTSARSHAARERVRRIRLENRAEGLAGALRGLGTGALPSLWPRLPGMVVPTLLLAGAEDPKFVAMARRMAERLPDGVSLVVDGAGHSVHLDRPEPWLDAVRGHLDQR